MNSNNFSITSKSFKDGELIPKKHTCQGQDVSPELSWTNSPNGTKSFALICNDPDASCGTWTHWLVKNIPPTTTSIPEDSLIGEEVITSWGSKKWKGPMPPSGTHHYFFKLYALSVDKMNATTLAAFYKECESFKIGEAVLLGKYKKN